MLQGLTARHCWQSYLCYKSSSDDIVIQVVSNSFVAFRFSLRGSLKILKYSTHISLHVYVYNVYVAIYYGVYKKCKSHHSIIGVLFHSYEDKLRECIRVIQTPYYVFNSMIRWYVSPRTQDLYVWHNAINTDGGIQSRARRLSVHCLTGRMSNYAMVFYARNAGNCLLLRDELPLRVAGHRERIVINAVVEAVVEVESKWCHRLRTFIELDPAILLSAQALLAKRV